MTDQNFKSLDLESKLNLMFEKLLKLDSIEANIKTVSTDVAKLTNRLVEVEEKIENVVPRVSTLETSSKFVSEQYDDVLNMTKDLKGRVKALETENATLNGKLLNLHEQLEVEKAKRNEIGQYQRTSHNVKICGVPFQKVRKSQKRCATVQQNKF